MNKIKMIFLSALFLFGCKTSTKQENLEDQYTYYRDSSSLFLNSKDPYQIHFEESHKKDSIEFYAYLRKENLYPFNKTVAFHDAILINNKFELIEYVEPILFRIYGKSNIIGERPYSVCLVGDYWFLSGSLPPNTKGGVFEITINRKTCEIIYLIHSK